MTPNILILGASYGSLLGTRLLMAGHSVTLVCTPTTAELINREGTRVRFPLKGRPVPLEVHSNDLPGALVAHTPEQVDPVDYDLVVLAMQEAQYGAPNVSELMRAVAASRRPCLAIMNMPPLPYLQRIPGMGTGGLEGCYAWPEIWAHFEPGLVSLASPDPQAFRPPNEPKNVLEIGLPTNFKAAPLAAEHHTALLRALADDMETARLTVDGQATALPVKLKVHDSLFVPLAKWPMLVTGNYRCVRSLAPIAIAQAVHDDVVRSQGIYESVVALCLELGADRADLVPFEKYASAARGLVKPSSAARALESGAHDIERVDRLVLALAQAAGQEIEELADTVALVDERLAVNRSTRQVA